MGRFHHWLRATSLCVIIYSNEEGNLWLYYLLFIYPFL